VGHTLLGASAQSPTPRGIAAVTAFSTRNALQDESALGQLDPSASHPIRDAERLALLLERGDGVRRAGSAVFRFLAVDDY
jgi:hypothetical protein